jgi:uncharacterized membrane protein YdjX (TVP38/TMEM64 family)
MLKTFVRLGITDYYYDSTNGCSAMKPRYWVVLGLWILLLLGFWFYVQMSKQPITSLLATFLRSLAEHPLSIWFLLALYLLRPLLLLPISILTVFAGFLYGPIFGTIYALIASLMSSSVGYATGRFFGRETVVQSSWIKNLREQSFETVLTSRLIFLPGDLVNYICGFLRVSFMAFLLATALGGLPGLVVGVLAGASIEGQFSFTGITINGWYIAASLGLLGLSLGASYLLRSRSRG